MDDCTESNCVSMQSNKSTTMDVQDGHVHGQNDEEAESRPWSHLPVDLIKLIIGCGFSVVDQIRSCAVCKNWRLAKPTEDNKKLPWLLDYRWDSAGDGHVVSSYAFYTPTLSEPHIQHNIIKDEGQYNLHGAGICASKHGWLLLQKGEMPFLYNPLMEVIKLPKMDPTLNRSTFSSVPTSPDCLCFSIRSSKDGKKLRISICSPRDNKWSTRIVGGFKKAIEDVVYSDGNLFCVFTGGVLGMFCVKEMLRKLLTDMNPPLEKKYEQHGFRLALPTSRDALVESNGELLLVHVIQNIFHVYTFNRSQNVWERRVTLGNRALFVGCTSFAVSTDGPLSHLAERIYFHTNARTGYFDMKTGTSCYCTAYYPSLIDWSSERVWIDCTWS